MRQAEDKPVSQLYTEQAAVDNGVRATQFSGGCERSQELRAASKSRSFLATLMTLS